MTAEEDRHQQTTLLLVRYLRRYLYTTVWCAAMLTAILGVFVYRVVTTPA